MFKNHPSFRPPENGNQKCWRYLDFTKFIDLIDSSQLFFTRIDKLEDPYEGTYTKRAYEQKNKAGLDHPNFYKLLITKTLVNCWHMNEHESAAMWKLYLKSDEGIAIQTTYDRIVASLDLEKELNTFVGKVNYLDYEKDSFDWGNTYNAFLHKRRSFEHERELRIIIDLSNGNPGIKTGDLKIEHGHRIGIKLTELIESVYISPTAPKWIFKLIKSILTRYQLDFPVYQSKLIGNILI